MSPHLVTCPACRAVLRMPLAAPPGRLRCPKCKETFEPIIDGQVLEESESVAVVLEPPSQPPQRDADESFFEWLADAKDPLEKKPAYEPILEAEIVEEPPSPRPRRRKPRVSEERRRSSNNGAAIAVIALVALIVIVGLAGAGYLVYRLMPANDIEDEPPPQAVQPLDKSTPVASAPSNAKVHAATVRIRTHYPDGQVGTATGFFVPGPGLVLTNARSVGKGKKPVAASKVQIILGNRTLGATILGADGDLDLALLQVVALDLPEGLPLTADTFPIKESHPVIVYCYPDAESKSAAVSNANVAGTREVAGNRPWFTLGGRLPSNIWGGPVTDSTGHLIGVAGVIPGSDTPAAVPVETARAFVEKTVRSVEPNGAVALTPPPENKKAQPREEDQDPFNPFIVLPPNGFQMNPPRGLPPNWNVPMMPAMPAFPGAPPGFEFPQFPQPGRPGGRQPGVPRPKLSFPPVEPMEIRPAPLAGDRLEMKLPGKVSETCTGGGGRFWFLQIPSEKQIAVFDTASAKIVKSIEAGENAKFAAGMNKLVVAEDAKLTRYDLKTFEAEEPGRLPFDGHIDRMVMGSASAGPIFATYHRNDGRLMGSASYAILDLATFKELEPGAAGGRMPMGFNREPMQLRASPDGRTITAFGGGEHLWHTFTLNEDGATIRPRHEPGVIVNPAEDGALLASTAIYGPDGRMIKKDMNSVLRVPSQHGPLFLTVTADREPFAFPNPNRPLDGPQTITLNAPGIEKPLATVADPGVSIPLNFGWDGVPGLQADRRVFFCPTAQLVGLIADDRLVLHRFDPDAAAEKGGASFLYVTSRPPIAERGQVFRYKLEVKSKAGNVQVRLESGPPGMRLEGTTVIWDVPARGAIAPDRVTLIVSDDSRQEVPHVFSLRVKD